MIEGRKSAIRPVESGDLSFLRELANDRVVASSVGGWAFPLSDRDQATWWELTSTDSSTRRFVIVDKAGASIGLTGLWDIDWHNRNALTAVKLHPQRNREKGIATDSIKTVMAYAFYDVGLVRLWSEILAFNAASMGAYVKNSGWRIEGLLRGHTFRGGEYRDVYRIGVLKSDFDQLDDADEYVKRVVPIDTASNLETRPEWWVRASIST